MTAGGAGEEHDWLALPRMLVSPVYDILGFSITDGGEGWLECTLVIRDELLNSDGVLHGGVWMLVADSAQGGAVRTLLTPEERTATVQSDFRWLRRLEGDRLRCVGRVARRTRQVWHTSVECFDVAGTLVATGTGTFVVVPR
ncbi:MAG: PaaI family thioesterase [Dehalococcoidia bacterium]|nr:MAG: PaaI family thioesterase [Dehalococcoidia bacterium]